MKIIFHKSVIKSLFDANIKAGERFLKMAEAKYPENQSVREASEKDLEKLRQVLMMATTAKGPHIIITDEEK